MPGPSPTTRAFAEVNLPLNLRREIAIALRDGVPKASVLLILRDVFNAVQDNTLTEGDAPKARRRSAKS